jgi:hypothetical protein
MLHSDLALGLRLERAAMAIEGQYARAHSKLRPDLDIEIVQIADGAAIFDGIGSPMSQTTGLGLAGPIVDADVEAVESFYFRRKAEARIVVCPLAYDSLFAVLKSRGYRLGEFENTLVRPLHSFDAPRLSTDFELVELGSDEADRYADAVGPNFVVGGTLTPELREMIHAMMGAKCSTSVLARVEDRDAGGGALLICDQAAMLAGAGVLPEFRNRGIHTTLFDYRLALAKQAGCDVAVMGARPGSTSQRNAERKGFQVGYTKCVMVREPG